MKLSQLTRSSWGVSSRRSVLRLIIEIERLPQMGERTTEFGAKQMADAQGSVRDQLGVAVISAFGKPDNSSAS